MLSKREIDIILTSLYDIRTQTPKEAYKYFWYSEEEFNNIIEKLEEVK